MFSIMNINSLIIVIHLQYDDSNNKPVFVKDLGIALEESRRLGISMPGTALAN